MIDEPDDSFGFDSLSFETIEAEKWYELVAFFYLISVHNILRLIYFVNSLSPRLPRLVLHINSNWLY